jgi:signal transduction histidine kinase
MFLSLSFSVFIYKTTESELTAQVNQHVQDITESTPNGIRPDVKYIEESKERLYNRLEQNKNRLMSSLAILNLIILVGSTGISYGLARFTLLPIENDRERQVRFTADASHELKTPLAAMKTQLEVALSTSTLDNPTRALLESNVE